MKRAGIAWLAFVLVVLAHTSDLEVDHIKILTGREGTFLELQVSYPLNDTLRLKVVRTDRSKGVFEVKEGGRYREVGEIPIPHGVSNFGLRSKYRIRLVGGSYKPGEEVPVTLLFPAGALITLPTPVEAVQTFPYLWVILVLIGALLLVLLILAIQKRRAARASARAR